ncbi:hypothetical protein [Natrinema versiforme]|nr:hypothetical protein [Natrinema versiforme]
MQVAVSLPGVVGRARGSAAAHRACDSSVARAGRVGRVDGADTAA